ncbi:DUF2235 domain-containing protein [Alteromonas sp. 5E99-2]|uniref:phospholipase effector Tle1 domain-containing protein n=1 Tax=Alteromonas sp. 5E99-2 TaxID=2817683 RepID=UPI001A982F75|nr:DUF2235 domain-containing protein [Alteromonas sp. 5E99-2]MBO1256896.1 DUF2235 domain-containing protein [Alteromonas sp. 5E99-2]
MALLIFNFDGTGNEPVDAHQTVKKGKKEDDNITNILKFHFLCGGNLHFDQRYGESSHGSIKQCFYYQGVGTYGDWLSRLVNQGVSPESRDIATILNRAYADFNQSYQIGDTVIVTGFSRGAAIARRFCSKLIEKSSYLTDGCDSFIHLAVFDTVASIGLPNLSQSDRPDYDVVFEKGCTLSPLIKQAVHMVSLDDKRKAFQPTLMNYDPSRIVELWFAGAHSDVGGGYYRDGLSDISLTYLIEWIAFQVKSHNLIDPALKLPDENALNALLPDKLINKIGLDDIRRAPNELGKNHQQDRWPIGDWLTLEDRICCVIEQDQISTKQAPIIHYSIVNRIAFDKDYRPKSLMNLTHQVWCSFSQANEMGKGISDYFDNPRSNWYALEVGESMTVSVESASLYTHSGILVEQGESYDVSSAPSDTWTDGSITCDANGWTIDDEELGWKGIPIKVARKLRRVPKADWFTLCISIGRDDELAEKMGCSGVYTVKKKGELTFFANDIVSKMANNMGTVDAIVTRIA